MGVGTTTSTWGFILQLPSYLWMQLGAWWDFVQNLPLELRKRELCRGVVVKLNDSEGLNGQPIHHEELVVFRDLARDT